MIGTKSYIGKWCGYQGISFLLVIIIILKILLLLLLSLLLLISKITVSSVIYIFFKCLCQFLSIKLWDYIN